jgi:hypothetical protein
MYVLQSCNASRILGASCVHLATHLQFGGIGAAIVQAMHGDGRIFRAYYVLKNITKNYVFSHNLKYILS